MQKIVILNSGKCSWGKCLFCGWGKHDYQVSANSLIERFNAEVNESVTSVKVFGSGSFLDENQFPIEFQKHAASVMMGRELIIESRPEHVTKEKLELYKGVKLTIAMGLETADDKVLGKLCKGVTLEIFSKASKLIRDYGFKVKGYVLVNPPFDYEGLLERSVKFGLETCDELVLINTYPHAKAELFDLWIRGEWKPINEDEFNKLVEKFDDKRIRTDFDNYNFEPRFPPEKQVFLEGVGRDYLLHPYFNVWQDYLNRFYKKPDDKDIVLFLPCSKRKPYFNSRTHTAVRRVLSGFPWYRRAHIVVISNPGVIPIEFAGKYPFNAYDWDERGETPEVKNDYIEVTRKRIIDYLKSQKYNHYLSYFKPASETGIALKQAVKVTSVSLNDLCDEEAYERDKDKRNPLIQRRMLDGLKNKLKIFTKSLV